MEAGRKFPSMVTTEPPASAIRERTACDKLICGWASNSTAISLTGVVKGELELLFLWTLDDELCIADAQAGADLRISTMRSIIGRMYPSEKIDNNLARIQIFEAVCSFRPSSLLLLLLRIHLRVVYIGEPNLSGSKKLFHSGNRSRPVEVELYRVVLL